MISLLRFSGISKSRQFKLNCKGSLIKRSYTSAPKRPNHLKYTKSHEWVNIEGKIATVGITEDAVSQLGDIVFVDLPKVGDTFEQGSTFGFVESVKAASDIYAPVSGEVIEVNSRLSDEPSLVSSDSFGEGWMIKMNMTGEPENLLSSEEYAKVCEEGGH